MRSPCYNISDEASLTEMTKDHNYDSLSKDEQYVELADQDQYEQLSTYTETSISTIEPMQSPGTINASIEDNAGGSLHFCTKK